MGLVKLGTTTKPIKNNDLPSSEVVLGTTPLRGNLFHVEKQIEYKAPKAKLIK